MQTESKYDPREANKKENLSQLWFKCELEKEKNIKSLNEVNQNYEKRALYSKTKQEH